MHEVHLFNAYVRALAQRCSNAYVRALFQRCSNAYVRALFQCIVPMFGPTRCSVIVTVMLMVGENALRASPILLGRGEGRAAHVAGRGLRPSLLLGAPSARCAMLIF